LREKIGTRLVAFSDRSMGLPVRAGAGEPVGAALHPEWGIPVHSLYGATRRPTPRCWRNWMSSYSTFRILGRGQ
jgi:uncharacterized protein YbbC (DUF1343 family)